MNLRGGLSALAWPVGSAVLAGLWALAFLGFDDPQALVSVPLLAFAVLWVREDPPLGVMALCGAAVLTYLADVRYGGLELLAPSALVLFSLGRREPAPWLGLTAVAVVAGTAALREGLTLRKLLVCALVFGSTWLFGRLVRRRANAATAAVAEAERLADADPRRLAHARAAAERRRVADESAAALRAALRAMRARIDDVLATTGPPDRAALQEIRECGAGTVEELRHLLTLLRREPGPSEASDARPQPPPLWGDLFLAGAAAAVAVLTLWQVTGWTEHPWIVHAYAGVVLSLALRRTMTVAAVGVLIAAMVPLAVTPPGDPESLLLVGAGAVAHLWVLVNRDTALARALAAAVVIVAVVIGVHFGADGTGFIAVLLAAALGAGRAWGEPDRIVHRAEQESRVLQVALERATAEAIQQERLRIARDLHDATGHAVGVVLMQVSKAEALAATDPDASRAALVTAREAGVQARAASDPLLPGIGGEAVDAATLRTEVMALIEQWRDSGLRITADLREPFPRSPAVAGATYHVVQEALTNCSRYAPDAEITVRIASDRQHLLVEVSNTAVATVAAPHGSGTGLTGVRERVTAAGGQLSTGRFGNDGFRVAARFPVPRPSRSTP